MTSKVGSLLKRRNEPPGGRGCLVGGGQALQEVATSASSTPKLARGNARTHRSGCPASGKAGSTGGLAGWACSCPCQHYCWAWGSSGRVREDPRALPYIEPAVAGSRFRESPSPRPGLLPPWPWVSQWMSPSCKSENTRLHTRRLLNFFLTI